MKKNNPVLAINGGTPVSGEIIPIHRPFLDEVDCRAAYDAVKTTFVSGDGPSCREFEKQLEVYLGCKHVFFMTSCTVALDLAFRAKGFPPDSEVLVPNFTYTSTALGPLLNNLRVRLVDVDPENGNVDVGKIEAAVGRNTVAIAPVDYAGNPADMDVILEIAQRRGLYVVHDAAQSIGAEYKGRKTGVLADSATFSFHGTKNMTTGEGGALVTNNDALAEKIRIMREKGTDKYSYLTGNITRGFYQYVSIGNSYVQSNINGALGVRQLQKLEEMNEKRSEIARYYCSELSGIEGLKFLKRTPQSKTNWHIFGILVPAEYKFWIMDALRAEGVAANVHYSPLHLNPLYRGLAEDKEMPGSMQFYDGLLRLPIYPSLAREEQESVVKAVRKIFYA
jgi:perosamine synthetase